MVYVEAVLRTFMLAQDNNRFLLRFLISVHQRTQHGKKAAWSQQHGGNLKLLPKTRGLQQPPAARGTAGRSGAVPRPKTLSPRVNVSGPSCASTAAWLTSRHSPLPFSKRAWRWGCPAGGMWQITGGQQSLKLAVTHTKRSHSACNCSPFTVFSQRRVGGPLASKTSGAAFS